MAAETNTETEAKRKDQHKDRGEAKQSRRGDKTRLAEKTPGRLRQQQRRSSKEAAGKSQTRSDGDVEGMKCCRSHKKVAKKQCTYEETSGGEATVDVQMGEA